MEELFERLKEIYNDAYDQSTEVSVLRRKIADDMKELGEKNHQLNLELSRMKMILTAIEQKMSQ